MLSDAGSRRARPGRAAAGVVALLAVLLAKEMPAVAEPSASPAPVGSEERSEDWRTELYREGVAAATAGLWTEARDRFRQTLAIRSSPKVLFSLAQAEEQLGQVASAQADYGRAHEGAKAAGESEVVLAADQARQAVAPRVPHIRVVVSGADPASVNATLDDQPVAVGTSVAADPGAHRLLVSAPGMREVTSSIAIGERQQLDVPVRLEPVRLVPIPLNAAAVPAAPVSGLAVPGATNGAAVPWRTVGLVTMGAGVVVLGASAALGLVAKSEDDQSNSSGCQGDNCTASAAVVRRDALGAANAATALFVVGGVLAASGLVLWLVAPSGEADRAIGVTPVALAGGSGVFLTGRWR